MKLTVIVAAAGSKDRPKSFQPAAGDDALEFVSSAPSHKPRRLPAPAQRRDL